MGFKCSASYLDTAQASVSSDFSSVSRIGKGLFPVTGASVPYLPLWLMVLMLKYELVALLTHEWEALLFIEHFLLNLLGPN